MARLTHPKLRYTNAAAIVNELQLARIYGGIHYRDSTIDGAVIARAGRGTEEILYAEVDLASTATSHARQLFLRHRRLDLYAAWLSLDRK